MYIFLYKGILIDDQILIFDGGRLEDHLRFLDYYIQSESELNLVLKLRGGG